MEAAAAPGAFIRNCWYVAAWDTEVPADGFLARTLLGRPLVLWRDAGGAVVAFDDRCCHRGARLSMGRKEDADHLRCMYHGLVFDRDGLCVSAPAQERMPPRARVRSYPVVEAHRWVWIWMGEPDLADPAAIADTHWIDDPVWRSLDGYMHYPVDYLLIADNLLDFSHLPFVHPTTLGGSPDYAAVLPQVERKPDGVRLTKWVMNTEAPGYSAAYGGYAPGQRVDRWMFYDFLLPGVLLLDSGMVPAGRGDRPGFREGAIAFRGCQALTPETAHSTHYFFAHPHNFLIDQPEVTRAIHAGILKAFEEDRAMITAQAANLAADPAFAMVPFNIDAALAHFRRIVAARVAAERAPAATARPAPA